MLTLIESNDLKEIKKDIKEIKEAVTKPQQTLADQWVDIPTACKILNISIRTCAKYRYEGILPFSQYSDKIYFKVADLQAHLVKHYKPAFKNS